MSLDKATGQKNKEQTSWETKSDGNVRTNARRKKKKMDRTQDDPTLACGIEDAATAAGSTTRNAVRPKASASKPNAKKSIIALPPQPAIKEGKNKVTAEVEKVMEEFVQTTTTKGVEGLRKEFADLKTYVPADFKYLAFSANPTKNRYKDVILRMLRSLPKGLCVIHCSAGIGRTGTVILIDAILGKLLKGQPVDVKEMFKKLRNQRASAVQTEAQYVFIHTCVLEYIRAKMPKKFRNVVAQFSEQVRKARMV
uniref:Tyrosine specific protein phosphatases domain-containing protein n=1 Tax=Panagrolaimus sp. JU765 TaxID=591449 RepID=A0AC34QZU1_9BILA